MSEKATDSDGDEDGDTGWLYLRPEELAVYQAARTAIIRAVLDNMNEDKEKDACNTP